VTWTDDRNQPQARVLLDSVSPDGHRLTTIEVTCHRFVLAEFNTHRVFSRNSASSRAIPVAKQIEKVRKHPAIPVVFPAEQKGMQGGEALSDALLDTAESVWRHGANSAVEHAEALVDLGVHKSVVNRFLEPFLWHTIIVSATDWEGFWRQRCSSDAQPEIRVAAEAMKAAYNASTPTPLAHGEWHTPLIQPDEDEVFWADLCLSQWTDLSGAELRKRVSTARCARVSYLTHDGKRDIEADLTLYDRLVTADPGHWSPLEHVATPCGNTAYVPGAANVIHVHPGNFTGWDQHRHEVERA
jgi:thymidylate synthase ThyX